MTTGLTPAEFDQQFQLFADSPTSTSVFRWEALQYYAISSDEPSLVAFRTGGPRPERSVRTSDWLRRVATSTAAGKTWARLRYAVQPLSEYLRWEMLAYIESQAAGELVLLTETVPDGRRADDFWLFDGSTEADRRAIWMRYHDDGTPESFDLVTDPVRVQAFAEIRDTLMHRPAWSLNTYLAERVEVSR